MFAFLAVAYLKAFALPIFIPNGLTLPQLGNFASFAAAAGKNKHAPRHHETYQISRTRSTCRLIRDMTLDE